MLARTIDNISRMIIRILRVESCYWIHNHTVSFQNGLAYRFRKFDAFPDRIKHTIVSHVRYIQQNKGVASKKI